MMCITIVAVQSRITGEWNYGPEHALDLLHLDMTDKPSGYRTARAAIAAARSDRTIPAGAVFKVQSDSYKAIVARARQAALAHLNAERAKASLPALAKVGRVWWQMYGPEWIRRTRGEEP